MERDHPGHEEERELTGVARGQHVLYALPHDISAVEQFLAPVLEKIDPAAQETSVAAITPDPETAIEVARATLTRGGSGLRVVPVTGARRATRLLRDGPAHLVAGPPDQLLELLRASSLKLSGVRTAIVAWADAVLDAGHAEALEAVLAEMPKEAARVIVTSQLTPAVEQFVERYARRARRVGDLGPWEGAPLDIRYVSVSPAARPSTLRRLLDELDPQLAAVYLRTDAAERELRELLRAFGHAQDDGAVRVTRGAPVPDATLLILYELPASREELRTVAGDQPRGVIALAQPRQLGLLRTLAAGGRVSPLTLHGAADHARTREEALRGELRAVLADGAPARELLSLEPLLEEFDGIEIAAAALRLLERARERLGRVEATARAAPAWTRVFINAGARDNVTPRDLVGVISGEAGIRSDRIGKIELRDRHSLVEIATPDADTVVRKLSGTMVRGRRLVTRIDRERARPEEGGSARAEVTGQRQTEHRDRGPAGRRGAEGRPRRDER